MPCDDCSRTESCPPCPYEKSEDSKPLFAPGAMEYYRKVLKLDEPERPRNYNHRCASCGHIKGVHSKPGGACDADWDACDCPEFVCDHSRCGWKRPEERPVQEECQHPNKQYTGSLYDGPGGRKSWLYYMCPDCKKRWKEEEPDEHDFSSPSHCAACARKWIGSDAASEEAAEEPCDHTCDCEHDQQDHSTSGYCNACGDQCDHDNGHYPSDCPQLPDEPPLTPEEEEQAPPDTHDWHHAAPEAGLTCTRCGLAHKNWDGSECPAMQAPPDEGVQCWHTEPGSPCDWNACRQNPEALSPPEGPEYEACVCGHIVPEHEPHEGMCFNCECTAFRTKPDFELPPQPDRRPPYAVAYSVQGHLYEVALPGDATVRAVDGALVIQHPLGPVAGIVQVLPVNGESA